MSEDGNRSELVVIDFSGTLSLDAVLFGQEKSLKKALRSSSLWELGIDSLDVFWNELINPTWEEGSTTPQGYITLLTARVRQWLQAQRREVPEQQVEQSVQHFARLYLHASRIHTAWRRVLQHLLSVPLVIVVIATDHYAEATAHIVAQLQRLGLGDKGEQQVLVANSADIGARKESPVYWEHVRARLPAPPNEVILIDDFGANENLMDAYASEPAVARRREATVAALKQVFGVPIVVYEFVIAGEQVAGSLQELHRAYRQKVRQVDTLLRQRLVKSETPRSRRLRYPPE